jgi:hypothetical protein
VREAKQVAQRVHKSKQLALSTKSGQMAPRRKTRRLQKEDSDIEDGEDAMQEGQDPVNQEQDEDPEQGPAAADDEAYERAVAAINNFRDQPLDAGADTKIKGVISDWTALLTLVKEGFDVMQDAAVAVQEVADEDQKDEVRTSLQYSSFP